MKKGCKIRYTIEKEGLCVKLTIHEMDERYRCDHERPHVSDQAFKAKNGIEISSFVSPALGENYIYMRGLNRSADNVESRIYMKDIKSRDRYANGVIDAIADWSKNWNWEATSEPEGYDKKNDTIETIES